MKYETIKSILIYIADFRYFITKIYMKYLSMLIFYVSNSTMHIIFDVLREYIAVYIIAKHEMLSLYIITTTIILYSVVHNVDI